MAKIDKNIRRIKYLLYKLKYMKKETKIALTLSDYRIVEFMGTFRIQKKSIEKKGMLWWKKTEEHWRPVDEYGTGIYHIRIGGTYIANEKKSYPTLDEAQNAILKFINGPIYHQLS